MKDLISPLPLPKTPLPVSYSAVTLMGDLIGQYFAYKKDTQMIKAKREELRYQRDIALKQIAAALQVTLDTNEKNYNKEMHRLRTIDKELEVNRNGKKMLLNGVHTLTLSLLDPTMDAQTKEHIPQTIKGLREMILELESASNAKLQLIHYSNDTTTTKMIEE